MTDVPPGIPDGTSPARVRGFVRRRPWTTAIVAVLALGAVDMALLPIPTLMSYRSERPERTAFQEAWLQGAGPTERRTIRKQWVPLKRMSPALVRAVLVSEDASFWQHSGLDWFEIRATVEQSIERKRAVRGASTITQQLMKNLFLTASKNPLRKWHELVLTLVAEQTLSKSRILELYLNEIEWGPGVYGAEQGARSAFGVPASDLTPEQAALMAAVIPNPKRYNAARPSAYVRKRADRILSLMGLRPAQDQADDPAEILEDPAEESGVDGSVPPDSAATDEQTIEPRADGS